MVNHAKSNTLKAQIKKKEKDGEEEHKSAKEDGIDSD